MRYLDIKREFAPDDVAAVERLLDAAQRADGHQPLSDHLLLDMVRGGRDGFAGLVAWEPGHPHPVAYAQVSPGNATHTIELVIDPHHRYEMATIGPEMLDAALQVVIDGGGGAVNWWVYEPTSAHDLVAADLGLHAGRELHQMRVALPTDRPIDVVTRAFVPGRDEAEWLAVNNRAFASHPEQGGWTAETLQTREGEDWFDAAGFLIHEREGRMAGFCWTKVHAGDDPALGEIYVIAVDPDFHGLGLGRALTLAGLDYLARPTPQRPGLEIGMLYVDASNAAAIGLYLALGFTIHRTDRAYLGKVPNHG